MERDRGDRENERDGEGNKRRKPGKETETGDILSFLSIQDIRLVFSRSSRELREASLFSFSVYDVTLSGCLYVYNMVWSYVLRSTAKLNTCFSQTLPTSPLRESTRSRFHPPYPILAIMSLSFSLAVCRPLPIYVSPF